MTSETLDKRTALLPRLLANRSRVWSVGVVLLGSWLLAASSWAEIPMVPVPMTLQTYALFVIAGLAGARLAFEITLVWLLQAAIGLPVLAGGSGGLDALTGPTAGYLAGMLLAAPMAGQMAQRDPRWAALAGVFLSGHVLVLFLGSAWLATKIGLGAAFAAGSGPFLLGAVVKSLAAAATVWLVARRVKVI